jgi:hypothetical protein
MLKKSVELLLLRQKARIGTIKTKDGRLLRKIGAMMALGQSKKGIKLTKLTNIQYKWQELEHTD